MSFDKILGVYNRLVFYQFINKKNKKRKKKEKQSTPIVGVPRGRGLMPLIGDFSDYEENA